MVVVMVTGQGADDGSEAGWWSMYLTCKLQGYMSASNAILPHRNAAVKQDMGVADGFHGGTEK